MKALAFATLSLALAGAPAAFAQTAGGSTGSSSPGSAAGTGVTSGGSMSPSGSTSSKGGTSRSGSRTQDLNDPLNPLSPQTDY